MRRPGRRRHPPLEDDGPWGEALEVSRRAAPGERPDRVEQGLDRKAGALRRGVELGATGKSRPGTVGVKVTARHLGALRQRLAQQREVLRQPSAPGRQRSNEGDAHLSALRSHGSLPSAERLHSSSPGPGEGRGTMLATGPRCPRTTQRPPLRISPWFRSSPGLACVLVIIRPPAHHPVAALAPGPQPARVPIPLAQRGPEAQVTRPRRSNWNGTTWPPCFSKHRRHAMLAVEAREQQEVTATTRAPASSRRWRLRERASR